VPYLSIALTSLSSSSGAQPPLTTSEAILANHLLRQSLFVRFGTCLAMACHLEGAELPGSSVAISKGENNNLRQRQHTFFNGGAKELVL
jgi:hypothetical protein